jgi:hypothetical protein
MSVPSVTMTATIGMRYLAKPSIAFFIFDPFSVYRSARLFHRRSTIKNPGHTTGVSALQHLAMQGNASSPLGDKSMRAQYAENPPELQ